MGFGGGVVVVGVVNGNGGSRNPPPGTRPPPSLLVSTHKWALCGLGGLSSSSSHLLASTTKITSGVHFVFACRLKRQ